MRKIRSKINFRTFRHFMVAGMMALACHATWILPAQAQSPTEFTLQIVDSETRQPLHCSVFVQNQRGVAQKVPTLMFSYDHFISPGEAVLTFTPGNYLLEIERGLEYYPVKGHFVLSRSARDIKTEKLRRLTDLSKTGWWSGDLDVRRPSREIKKFMMASDTHLAAVMHEKPEAKAGPKAEKIPDDAPTWFDRDRVFGTRNYLLERPGCVLSLLNLAAPLEETMPRLAEDEKPGEVTLQALYRLRQQEPNMVIALLDADTWDVPVLAAMGLLDSVQVLGPHVTRDMLLPRDIDWKLFPKTKTSTKLNLKRLVKEKETTDQTPSQRVFPQGTTAVRYAGVMGQQLWTEDVYFHLLNTGHRVVPSAGSGSGLSPNGVGANRVYAHVDAEGYRRQNPEKSGFAEEGADALYDWDAWWDAFRQGEVVITNGPLMQPFVEGCFPGETLDFVDDEPVSLELGLTLATREQIQYLEIIVNGRVTQTVRFADAARTNKLPPINIGQSGWFLLRAVTNAEGKYCCAMSAPYYVRIGGKKHISRRSAEFFLNWEKERAEALRLAGHKGKAAEIIMKYHEFSLDYWSKMVEKATAE